MIVEKYPYRIKVSLLSEITSLIHVGRLSHEDRKTSSFPVWLFVAV
jgi:hypothetical protein